MSAWFYQLSDRVWPPSRFRLEVWEGQRWSWPVRTVRGGGGDRPEPGDTVVFFYSKTGSADPGFYGWAIVTEWHKDSGDKESMYFQPVAPTDLLKMFPWGDTEALGLADDIRGGMPRGTMWLVKDRLLGPLRTGILRWLHGHQAQEKMKSRARGKRP